MPNFRNHNENLANGLFNLQIKRRSLTAGIGIPVAHPNLGSVSCYLIDKPGDDLIIMLSSMFTEMSMIDLFP